ncbi:MAG: hypothetical protein ACP5PZ_12255, partial [Bacteroidales bacterium]
PAYVNSWNMDKVEINGVDYTNKWSNSMPPAIGGKWYIYYKGSYAWSHFEIPAAKNLVGTVSAGIEIFPNPFTDIVHIRLNGLKTKKIEVYSSVGQLLNVLGSESITGDLVNISLNYPGNIFIVKIWGDAGITNHLVFKK